jgi:nitrite reductase/ring-hydroxylating ferredoxin subunit
LANWDFWDWCLAGLSVFGVAAGLLIFLAYALPQEPLVIPEVESSVRIANLDDVLNNTARLERWGKRLILVVRTASGEVTAVEGRSPADGCVLQWDEKLGRIQSPCSYQLYNPYGFVVAGLDNRALRTFPVLIRDGVINIGSGS